MSFFLQAGKAATATTVIDEIGSIADFFTSRSMGEITQTLSDWVLSFGGKLLAAAAVFIIGKFIINKIHKVAKKAMLGRSVDISLTTFLLSIIKITLLILLILVVVGILGVQTTSFVAIFASAGIAIGLALSGTLQNFAGGVLILILKPYKVGDTIEVQGFTGRVKEIQIFHTIINTIDNKYIVLPNGPLSTGNVNNYSKEEYRRVDWSIGIAYGDDLDVAKSVILDMMKEDHRAIFSTADMENWEEEYKREGLEDMPDNSVLASPAIGISSLADSSVVLFVRTWVKSSDYFGILGDINERVYKEFGSHGLNFPFPQMDVHIKGN